ncbi:hypothetical protein FQA47_025520 [Oryzias melastigma]|uniref:Uncharacterized protein n=1 Tax=Oryzias melastigma TaxID=30732 RepID=A0A834FNW3_ORYME|nr:hypothetical protein FQA47_025520 [Oryzias melastigma]
MASGGEQRPAAESNEHDYANTADRNRAGPEHAMPEELLEPALGSEVDCPGADPDSQHAGSPVAPRHPARAEDGNCACCQLLFERHGRSFNRRAVYTFTTPDTVRWVFPESTVTEKSFLCERCAQVIRTRGRRKQSGKRSLWLKPPTPKKTKDKQAVGCRMGKKSTGGAAAKGARKPMLDFFSKQLKLEMKELSRQADSPFHLKVSGRKPLSSFPWRRCANWAQEKAPLVGTCLRSMFPDVNAFLKSSHQMSEEQAVTLLERRTVVALAIPLFTRNNWRNNFLQAALGAELRLQGCSGSALDTLNTMGLCQNKDTVRLLLHRLGNGKDALDGELGMMGKHEQRKEPMGDVSADEKDDEEEEEEEEEMRVEEEVEQEEVQDELQEEDDVKETKRRRKKAKRQKEEKRKGRGKRKERQESEEEEEQKKRKVVVVRLGLLKGHSEVGRSDLSAP